MNIRFAVFAAVLTLPLLAQTTPRPNNYRPTGAGTAQRLVSPQVSADRHITFRVRAPKAAQVELLFGAWEPKPQAMEKNAEGVWSLTIGPVQPDLYTYAFLVDGMRTLDMLNPLVKAGGGLDASSVDVPGTPARFDEEQNVPRGAIHVQTYFSSVFQALRRAYIYVPPQYASEPARRFPVLVLRHGGGDTEANWSVDGRAGVISDNLLAQQKTAPMIIVMTNGNTDGSWAGGSSAEGIEKLGKELFTDVLPFVEKNYRTLAGRENRAIVGLSMGGGQSFTIGLKNMDRFAYVGEFSSGLISDVTFDITKHLPGFIENPSVANSKLKLLYLSCGTDDPRINGQRNLTDLLKAHQIRYQYADTPGGHEWKVWARIAGRLPAAAVCGKIGDASRSRRLYC